MKLLATIIFSVIFLTVPGTVRGVEQASPMGRIDKIVLRSEALDEEVTILVRLPRNYESGSNRYPVLFLLDAEWHFNIATADVELLSECSYINPHPVPQLIVVGIVSNDRNRDYTPTSCPEFRGMRFPTSGRSESFHRFLIDELLPSIDEAYRTHPYRILSGWSLGGLFVIDTFTGGTPEFNDYLAISPSLWWDDGLILKQYSADRAKAGPSEPKKLIVTLGTFEKGGMVAESTNEFMDYLANNPVDNVTAELVPIEGLGHNYAPKMGFFTGLATLFGDWSISKEIITLGIEAIDGYYHRLSESYRFEIPVPEDVYGTLGWGLFEEDEKEAAREVFQKWHARHPESPLALASLGAFLREVGDKAEAIQYLTSALEKEKQSSNPRMNFILDLKRDIDSLRGD